MSDPFAGIDLTTGGDSAVEGIVPTEISQVSEFTSSVVFDIETGPEEETRLRELFKFDPADVKGLEILGETFDPENVKLGNARKPAAVDAKIQAAREKFEKETAAAKAKLATAKDDAWAQFVEDAALSATTGQILLVGYGLRHDDGEFLTFLESRDTQTEQSLLQQFWMICAYLSEAGHSMIGFNSNTYDVPFLLGRSWRLGVPVPAGIWSVRGSYFNLAPMFVDMRTIWGRGDRNAKGKLGEVAEHFGLEGKSGDGAEFYRLWTEDRAKAFEYARNDIRVTWQLAEKLKLV